MKTEQLMTLPTFINGNFIKVYDTGTSYVPVVMLADGTLVEHEPFPHDAKGRVCALDLAQIFEGGKVFLKQVVVGNGPRVEVIEAPKPRKGVLR